MRKHYYIVILILIKSLISNSQIYGPPNNIIMDSLMINNIKVGIYNNNILSGRNDGSNAAPSIFPVFESPIGSNKHTIFSGSLLIRGKNNNNLYLAAQRYKIINNDFYPGPISDSIHYTALYDSTWKKIWKVSRQDILYHVSNFWLPGYVMPSSISTWPAHGNTAMGQSANLAPFVDYNNNGVYDPQNGDYPLIRGDECIFFICNDDRGQHFETGGRKFKIEIHGMLYAYNCPQSQALNESVFLHYDIYNRSNNVYDTTIVGYFVDFDIGNYLDDFIGTHVSKSYIFGYNGTSVDGNSAPGHYGNNPPSQACVFLRGIKQDNDGIDNNFGINQNESINGIGFGDGIIDNEYRGLDYAIRFQAYSGALMDIFWDFNMMLNGVWSDSTPLFYGGTGHYTDTSVTNILTRYIFPGNSDLLGFGTNGIIMPPWDEVNANNQPGSRAMVGSSGPFTFTPHSKQTLDLAFVYARDTVNAWPYGSLNLLESRVDSIRQMFIQDITPCGLSFSGIEKINDVKTLNKLHIYPNPNNGIFKIEFVPHLKEKEIYVFDSVGKLVCNKTIENNGNELLDLSVLDSGIYYIKTANSFGKIIITNK